MPRHLALVIGGSLSGLFAAHFLRRIGWDVALFERARSSLAGRGAGLGTQPALFEALRRIDIEFARSIAVTVWSRACLDRNGQVLCTRRVREVSTAWDRIYQALKQALPDHCYHPGKVFTHSYERGSEITALFADGSCASGHLLIGADGIKSSVRASVLPTVRPRYAGYVAWRGSVDADNLPPRFREPLLRRMLFCLPDQELAFTVPMAPKEGHGDGRRCMFGWFRPASRPELASLCTDVNGALHDVSIPPTLIRPEAIESLVTAAMRALAPQLQAVVMNARMPVLQPVFDLESPHLVFGRTVLIGDAAFVARPHVGTGVTKGCLDAQTLADTVAASGDRLPAALAHYERKRIEFGRWIVARGRRLAARLTEPVHRGGQGKLREAQTTLLEYGAAGIVDGESMAERCR